MDTTLFSNYPSKVSELLYKIESGQTALPDLQRPFVWEDVKVRNLLDSMNKGFPIGFVMLWDFPDEYEPAKRSSAIGGAGPQPVRSLLIDGQQRLTALLSAMDGAAVKDKDYKSRRIRISYAPLAEAEDGKKIGRFEVWTKPIDRNPEWISDISEVFKTLENPSALYPYCLEFVKAVNASREKKGEPLLSFEEDMGLVVANVGRLLALRNYVLPTIEINSSASEEDVAEIFVRVNSGGQKLMEKNFIETLLAVYDNDIHAAIGEFCETSRHPKGGTSYNPIIKPEPSHLIRAGVALGFNRARLRYAYMLMRGRDLKTGETTREVQAKNLAVFREAMEKVMDLNEWHAFLNLFPAAGYIDASLVTSENAVVYSYALYLIGKHKFRVPQAALRRAMTRYIFTVTIRAAYSNSPETKFESQLGLIHACKTADDFLAYIDEYIATQFTDDYFGVTLPAELRTSSPRSPVWCGFVASQLVLGSHVLFGTTPLASLLLPGASGAKKATDRHHLFPKNYLESIGITEDKERNQVANFVYLDYQTNIEISDRPPADYAAVFQMRLGDERFAQTCSENAVPENFSELDYDAFLKARRLLMAQLVRRAYEKLSE